MGKDDKVVEAGKIEDGTSRTRARRRVKPQPAESLPEAVADGESSEVGDDEPEGGTQKLNSRGIRRKPVARRPSRRRAVKSSDTSTVKPTDKVAARAPDPAADDADSSQKTTQNRVRARRSGSHSKIVDKPDSSVGGTAADDSTSHESVESVESAESPESPESVGATGKKPRRSRGRRGGRGRGGRRRAEAEAGSKEAGSKEAGSKEAEVAHRDDLGVAEGEDDAGALESGRRATRAKSSKASKASKASRGSRGSKKGRRPARRSDDSDESAADAKDDAPKPQRRILVNATDEQEVRIAVLAGDRLDDLHYERPAEKKYLGNVYKGRIVNLEPAIQAAFVDLGIGRNGFLHVSDVLPVYRDANVIPVDNLSKRPGDRTRLRIQDILRNGQEVLVQISKDSIGMKGPSLTTYVSVPGRYLVLMPGVSRHGVSKRIEDYEERAALRKRLANLDPPEGVGYIVRTAGEDMPDDVLEKDFNYLMGVWTEIREKVKTKRTPCLIFQEHDLVTRALRDLFGSDVEEIFVDEAEVYERAKAFLLDVMPRAAKRLKHYTGATPLFSKFGVEQQIERIYNRRVPLPSGGWIVIEQTEALVAIDVNSGKYRDEEDLEATALKTNLEAAEVIARELRLRDLGGVVINDFIDMENLANRRQLERHLKACLKGDNAKSWTTRVSRFGIIEMTRQRVRPSFESSQHERCAACSGSGWVKAARATGISVLRRLRGELGNKRKRRCEVTTSPGVVEYLVNERRRQLFDLEETYDKQVVVRADPNLAPDQYQIKYR